MNFGEKIRCKNEIYKIYINNGFIDNSYLELQDATNVVTEILNTRKRCIMINWSSKKN